MFAGCGGLSLGLKSSGFQLLLANEQSPMAAETFAYNLLSEDLDNLAKQGKSPKHTYWLHSQYPPNQINKRLRESPLNSGRYNDLKSKSLKIQGKLLVGNIETLNHHLQQSPKLLRQIKKGDISLVSGGPPCQSFSMAGKREYEHKRNQLPKEFATFVDLVKPKVVLLENVSGILHAFRIKKKKYYAWLEVAKTFASIGYIPLCLHINAKYVGVPQSRPRFIMLALRKDIFEKLQPHFNPIEYRIWQEAKDFCTQVQGRQTIIPEVLSCHNIEKEPFKFRCSFLKPLITHPKSKWIGAKEAIGDLKLIPSLYVHRLHQTLTPHLAPPLSNHKIANHSMRVKQRFRVFQVLEQVSSKAKQEVKLFLWEPESNSLSQDTMKELRNYPFLNTNGKLYTYRTNKGIIQHLKKLKSKRKIQRSLKPDSCSYTVLGLTDGHCHYDIHHLRALTIREKARLQSFPDSFVFRSKLSFRNNTDVSQNTQVGNAVPPLLAKALGHCIINLLSLAEK